MNASQVKSRIAYDKIRKLILTGKKKPGARLVLAELERELDMGRGPVREALMRLDSSGLVHNIPYKGLVVAQPPTLKEMVHLSEAHIHLEHVLAAEAMSHLHEQDFSELHKLMAQMREGSGNRFGSLNRRFHAVLHRRAGMPHLSMMMDRMLEYIELHLNMNTIDEATCRGVDADHGNILHALRHNDVSLLKEALGDNLRRALDIIRRGSSAPTLAS